MGHNRTSDGTNQAVDKFSAATILESPQDILLWHLFRLQAYENSIADLPLTKTLHREPDLSPAAK